MFEQHPLSAAFPAMPDDDFLVLKDSIEEIGVQNPITLFEGMVIDGWHRYRAATELGMDCPAVELAPHVDPRDFVLAQNKARRNCTHSQLATASALVYKWKPTGRPIKSVEENCAPGAHFIVGAEDKNCAPGAHFIVGAEDKNCAPGAEWEKTPAAAQSAPGAEFDAEPLSAKEIAAKAGVSTRIVAQAKKVIRNGAPEVVEAVKRGELSLKRAEEIAKLPPEQQPQAIHVKPERKPKPAYDADAELLRAKIKELQERVLELEEHRDYLVSELDAALRIIRADDQLAQAWQEVEKANKKAAEARSRVDGLMNEKNAAVRRVKALEREHGRSVH